jgi:hypothetical protein
MESGNKRLSRWHMLKQTRIEEVGETKLNTKTVFLELGILLGIPKTS